MSGIIELVRAAAEIRILFLPHAVRQMAHTDRMITVEDVRNCIFFGQVIEDNPKTRAGTVASCLEPAILDARFI